MIPLPDALHREPAGAPFQRQDAVVNRVGAWPRNRGAGGRLMRELCAAADAQGVTLRLVARNPAADGLYQACGSPTTARAAAA